MIKKIGITGAHSVGKTTLLNALRSEKVFKGYAICDEVTRTVRSYGVSINEQGGDTTQKLIMNEHIVNMFMNDRFITDRTALDGYVYSMYLLNNKSISIATFSYVERIYKKLWPMYDKVFFIEPEFDIVSDGVRSTDIKFRNDIANIFRNVIELEKLKVVLIRGSVRERVSTVITECLGDNNE